MKSLTNIFLLLLLMVFVSSCKSTELMPLSKLEITRGDFLVADASDYPDTKAVMISEELDFREQAITRPL